MFKNRHIQVKLVKDAPATNEAVVETVTPEDIERITLNVVKKVAIATIVTIAASVVLNTLSQIAVNACDNHEKEED